MRKQFEKYLLLMIITFKEYKSAKEWVFHRADFILEVFGAHQEYFYFREN